MTTNVRLLVKTDAVVPVSQIVWLMSWHILAKSFQGTLFVLESARRGRIKIPKDQINRPIYVA